MKLLVVGVYTPDPTQTSQIRCFACLSFSFHIIFSLFKFRVAISREFLMLCIYQKMYISLVTKIVR